MSKKDNQSGQAPVSAGMQEFESANALRKQYPLALHPKQQDEIVAQLPEFPERDDMVCLGLSHNRCDFQHPSELELYWKYQCKLYGGKAKKAVAAHHGKADPALANVQGLFLGSMLLQCSTSEGKDLPSQRKLEFCKLLLEAWEKETPPAIWALQKEGVTSCLNIHTKVHGKTPEGRAIGAMLTSKRSLSR